MSRTVDLRLALPVAAAWAVLALAVAWPPGWAAAIGLVLAAAATPVWLTPRLRPGRARMGSRRRGRRAPTGPKPGRRERLSAAVALTALTALLAGGLLAAVGLQGWAWPRTELGRAAAVGERVELVLRTNQPAKSRDSPWGGAGSVTAVGMAWPAGDVGGPGVPTAAHLDADALGGAVPAAGAVLTFRARLELAGRADLERVVARDIGPVAVARPDGWRGLVYDLRADLGGRANPLLEGIALGDTSRIDPALDAALKTTSLTHLTAVSGAHVAIVLGAVLGLAALAGMGRWMMAGLGVATLVGFTALIGPGPSVLRAVVMGLAALAGLAFGKSRLALGALAAAVWLVLAANPWLARSYGLLLSALATAGLIVLAPPMALAMRRRWPRLPAALAEATALTAAAQLVCAPVITIFAGQISLSALPANLLATPAVPVATVAAMVATAAGPVWPPLGDAAVAVGNLAAGYIGWVARWVADWPGSAVAWPKGLGGFATAVGATAALVGLVWWLRRRRFAVRLTAAAAAAVIALAAGPARPVLTGFLGRGPPADWVAAVCDVGQGTAAAVRSGADSAVLIDAGPAEGGVGECLSRLGVNRLDLVVLTHFHADHVGGLADALDGREVGEVVYGHACGQDAGHTLAVAQKAGARLREIVGEEPISGAVGSARVEIYPSPLAALCPDSAEGGEDAAANDAGLAVLAQVDGLAVWALGDLEPDGQAALLARLRREARTSADAQATPADSAVAAAAAEQPAAAKPPLPGAGGLVVVAHHGSARQSAALAEALAPKLAVMSAGRDNPYGHPSQAALDLYGSLAEVKRTDEDGLIAVAAADLDGGG
ncbi:MAG: ComEC/Rec2 family competence protein [Bifidobacteriaceae bacterium]|jgi:competence protein ComEC|nr:ComEC/Rec2 family competence protein [Bifidobacteriaceae bacterium]